MKRRQIAEPVNGFRLDEGTRERCFAPIRERQILRHDVNLSQYQVEGCGPGAIACGRASLRRVTACGPGRCPVGPPTSGGPRRALCAIGAAASRHAVFVPGLQGPGGRRAGVFRAVWGLRSLRGVGSLRAFVLDSSVVPSWVVAQARWVESRQVAFRRRFKIRPFGPSRPQAASGPPQAGGMRRRQNGGAAEGMTHDAPSTAPPGAHCCAYAPNDARPAADFPECAPWGHTPRNLTLFAHQPPTAAASGAEAVPVGSGCASSHPPALPCAGRGRGVTNPLRRDGGFSHRTADLYRFAPYLLASQMRSAYKGVSAASRIHHPRTGGGAGGGRGDARGAGCGVGCRGRGPPCGPPGKPQGAQGPRAATRAAPPLGLGPSTLDKLPSVW